MRMFGSLYMMCLSWCVHWMSFNPPPPRTPRDDRGDHMLTTRPDRCDKCSNTSMSKRRVIMCNFVEGPPSGTHVGIFILNER